MKKGRFARDRKRSRGNPEERRIVDRNIKPEAWVYRDRTTALLLRYLHMSVEVGRLPSILGQEYFRSHVSCYRVNTFEDAVIFVHDVERSLQELDEFSQQVIARVVLQEYTQEEAARLLGCARKTIGRCLPGALDQLSEIFLAKGILREWENTVRRPRRPCQVESGVTREVTSCK